MPEFVCSIGRAVILLNVDHPSSLQTEFAWFTEPYANRREVGMLVVSIRRGQVISLSMRPLELVREVLRLTLEVFATRTRMSSSALWPFTD